MQPRISSPISLENISRSKSAGGRAPFAFAVESGLEDLINGVHAIIHRHSPAPLQCLSGQMPNSHVRSCERPAKLSRRSRNVVFVYADESGKTFVSYDRPSALLGQFQNEKIGMVAQMLDQKLDGLANMAAR